MLVRLEVCSQLEAVKATHHIIDFHSVIPALTLRNYGFSQYIGPYTGAEFKVFVSAIRAAASNQPICLYVPDRMQTQPTGYSPLHSHEAELVNVHVLVGLYRLLIDRLPLGVVIHELQAAIAGPKPFRYPDIGGIDSHGWLEPKFVIRGVDRANHHGWVQRLTNTPWPQSVDMDWIIPGRIVASDHPKVHYAEAFAATGITTIVQLNETGYNPAFVAALPATMHHNLSFPDGTAPTIAIVKRFLQLMRALGPDSVVLVHCLQGIGRTGTLIATYLMAFFGFSALEAIGYLRFCRAGCIMGEQHDFLVRTEAQIRRFGLNPAMLQ